MKTLNYLNNIHITIRLWPSAGYINYENKNNERYYNNRRKCEHLKERPFIRNCTHIDEIHIYLWGEER